MRRGPSFARILGGGVAVAGRALTRVFGRQIGTRAAAHAAAALPPVYTVHTARGDLRLLCTSEMSAKRALGALRHEPDTLAWIDDYVRPGEHLWDIGANVGVYALYACLNPGVTATCFEPVAGTFAILSRNAALNGLSERITPLCVALSDADGVFPLHLASAEPGSSMHALRKAENVRGAFDAAGIQQVLALRGDKLIADFGVSRPHHVKLDVDGHERQVLEGMDGVLENVSSVWLEMTSHGEASGENARIRDFLNARGFAEKPFAPAQDSRNKLFVNARAER